MMKVWNLNSSDSSECILLIVILAKIITSSIIRYKSENKNQIPNEKTKQHI